VIPAPSPLHVYQEIKGAYLKYIDTAFWLRDPALLEERRALLDRNESIFTDVLLEPVLPYDSVEPLRDVFQEVGLTAESADLLGEALFRHMPGQGDLVRLRQHQARALRDTFKTGDAPGRNPIITSGTGSGKTESFLLPVLARLVQEAAGWGVQPPAHEWWKEARQSPRQIRRDEASRHPRNRPVPNQRARRGSDLATACGGALTRATRGSPLVRTLHRADHRKPRITTASRAKR
jgi:DEAD/DEAH box helicase domain-containing protein